MSAARIASVLVLALAVAAADWLVAAGPLGGCTPCLAWLVAGPVVLALLALAILRPAAVTAPPAPARTPPPETAALALLAALQEEGRLVDFLTEDIAPYSDAQVGAAVRLTGNVTGGPPFRGVLRHAGWRATAVTLSPRPGHDAHVIAPAEVELP